MSKDKQNRDDQLKTGKVVRVRGFPRAGVNHPVAHLPSYTKMSVTTEEYELVLAHRKQATIDREEAEYFLKARQDALDVYNNYKP